MPGIHGCRSQPCPGYGLRGTSTVLRGRSSCRDSSTSEVSQPWAREVQPHGASSHGVCTAVQSRAAFLAAAAEPGADPPRGNRREDTDSMCQGGEGSTEFQSGPEQIQDLPCPCLGKGEATGLWENVVFPSSGLPLAVGWAGSELRGPGKWGGVNNCSASGLEQSHGKQSSPGCAPDLTKHGGDIVFVPTCFHPRSPPESPA